MRASIGRAFELVPELNRAFNVGFFLHDEILGRCPRLLLNTLRLQR